ncbi:MAG: TRAP transporter substrate-binding protein [Synergistaceae bacterium]|nr:TRAP transporter substrate-binding protein [Synergistaceae bacterium]MBQ9594751.1 TRAP transporter substrate-binding protein [Synergistaceae bacterium]
MKKFLALTALFVLLASATAFAAPYTITVTHIVDEAHSWHKACEFFKQEIEKRSDGKIEVKIYPNSQLGNEIDTIQSALTGGGVDVVITGESMMTYVPELGILGVPYLMTSDAHVEAVAGGEIGKEIENLMLMDGAGFRCLAYFVRGPRDVTANKAIRTPDDIKGVIIRTPASTITVSTFEAFGAKPTPMAFSEVFTSLQSGTIQGQENPLAMIKSGNFYEVQKYLCKTEHLRTWLYFALSEQTFQSLPADLQKVVLEVGKEMQKYEHELFLKDEAELEGFLKSKGMEIIEDVDQAAFAKLADEAMQKLMAGEYSYLKPLYDKIKAVEPK